MIFRGKKIKIVRIIRSGLNEAMGGDELLKDILKSVSSADKPFYRAGVLMPDYERKFNVL